MAKQQLACKVLGMHQLREVWDSWNVLFQAEVES